MTHGDRYQKEVEKQIAANTLAEPGLPTIEELLAMPKPIAAKTIHTEAFMDSSISIRKDRGNCARHCCGVLV